MSIAAEKPAPDRRRVRFDAGAPGTRPPARAKMRADLRWSVADGSACSVMVGLGETYLPAFALALGMGGIAAGMVATVPVLLGAVVQLAAPWAVRRVGSHRRWVIGCVVCQGLSLLLLPWAIALHSASAWLLYAGATLYWATGLSSGPAWNTWIESIVPRRVRAQFFARRARIAYVSVLAGFVAGGLLLEAGKLHGMVLGTFVLLFGAAAVFRFGSASFLARHSEPQAGRLTDRRVGWSEMLSRVRGETSGRLLAYLLATQVAVQMASPYYVPYMLSALKFSYLQFTLLVGLACLGKAVMLPYWGRFADAVGPRRLLVVCGLAIAPLPLLWLVSARFGYLMGVQLFSGGIWCGFELAMLLMFFEAIPKEERTSVLTIYNLGNAAAMVAGSLLGAAALGLCGVGPAGYLLVFGLSSAGRTVTLLLLARIRSTAPQPSGERGEPIPTVSPGYRAVAAVAASIATPGTPPPGVPALGVPLLGGSPAAAAGCTVAAEASQ